MAGPGPALGPGRVGAVWPESRPLAAAGRWHLGTGGGAGEPSLVAVAPSPRLDRGAGAPEPADLPGPLAGLRRPGRRPGGPLAGADAPARRQPPEHGPDRLAALGTGGGATGPRSPVLVRPRFLSAAGGSAAGGAGGPGGRRRCGGRAAADRLVPLAGPGADPRPAALAAGGTGPGGGGPSGRGQCPGGHRAAGGRHRAAAGAPTRDSHSPQVRTPATAGPTAVPGGGPAPHGTRTQRRERRSQ